jgi:simple sugar transport system substrate-binding protein
MTSRWHVLLAGVAIGVLLAGGGPSPSALAQRPMLKKAAVVVPASRADQGWNQQAPDALVRVGKKLNVEVEIAENAGYGDIKPILRDLKGKGVGLIICHASGYQTACPEFAKESQVPVVVIENEKAVQPGLVSNIATEAHEAAYLAGVLAGKLTRTGVVGIVVSAEPPTWNFMSVGFAEGLRASRPNATLLYSVIGQAAYEDAAGAKRATEAQLGQRADIIFGQGDGASFGMMNAVTEHNKAGKARAWFIDVIGDKRATDKGKILLTSVMFDYSGAYERIIKDLAAGTFGKTYQMNLRNDGVRLLDLPASVPQAARAAVSKAKDDIIGGKVRVSVIGEADKARARLKVLFPTAIR